MDDMRKEDIIKVITILVGKLAEVLGSNEYNNVATDIATSCKNKKLVDETLSIMSNYI